ncbi:hypothetical protein [Pasteurella oralis]|uniref:hypothetical protein n=1 Tax=Pasteurella oralis TaxID=1071947 RepID=UPI000C7C1329|nr:hypothetical protein [Pasteurella oralis]
MAIIDAYCVQLERSVTITEARTEFLNQSKWKKFDFLCSTESCREKGIKMVGINYQIHPSDNHHNTPHYRNAPRQKESHCANCYLSYDVTQQLPGETIDEFKLRQTRAKLNDYVDEFELIHPDDKSVVSSRNVQSTKRQETIQKEQQEADVSIEKSYTRYTKTNQLVRLVESYLDSRRKLSNVAFKKLPLKIQDTDIQYLYQYFYGIKKGIEYGKHCVYMGDAILKSTKQGLFFQFFETIWENYKPKGYKLLPIYLEISQEVLDAYHYRRALLDHIKTNTYQEKRFKLFFIPNKEDIAQKTGEKDGREYKFHLFHIMDLRLFSLFTYSYLKKKS